MQPLLTHPVLQLREDVRTVGWTNILNRKRFVNQYGKRSAARYRLEIDADSDEYEAILPKEQCVSMPMNQKGDQKVEGTNSYKFTKRHIRAIYGVAWERSDTGLSEDNLRRIDPLNRDKTSRYPPTYVLID